MLSAHPALRSIYKLLLISPLLVASHSQATPVGFVESLHYDSASQKPFQCTETVINSPDDKFSYSSSFCDDALNTFSRDSITGKLTLLSSMIGNKETGEGLSNVQWLVMHPSGKYVFAFGVTGHPSSTIFPYHDAIYIYQRDPITGSLTYSAEFKDPLISSAWNMHISDDGHFLYVSRQYGIEVLQISDNGILTHTQSMRKTSTLSDYSYIRSLVFSSDNKYVYVDSGNNSISWLLRDATSGALNYAGELLSKGMAAGSGGSLRIHSLGRSNDGKHLYAFIEPNDTDKTVLRHFAIATDGSLTFIDDTLTTPASPSAAFYCPSEILVSANDKLLYFIDGCAANFQVWLRDTTTGSLKYIGAEDEDSGNEDIPEYAFSQANKIGFSNDGHFAIAAVNAGITTLNLTADLGLASSFQKTVATNDNYSGVITVTNSGPADAHEIEIAFTGNALSGLQTTNVSLPQGSCNLSAGDLVCKLPSLPSKAMETIELTLQSANALEPLQINVTKTQAEIDSDNQNDSLQIIVQPIAVVTSSSSSSVQSSSTQSSAAQSSSTQSSVASQQSSSALALPESPPSKKGGGSMGFEWLLLLTLCVANRKYKK